MRFFLVRNGAAIIGRLTMNGDSAGINAIVAQFQAGNPTLALTEVDQVTYDASPLDAATVTASQRSSALDIFMNDPSPTAKVLRAVVLVLIDEINAVRGLLSPPQAARTTAQARTAIQNKLNSGAAD